MLATSEAPFAPFSPPISSLGITLSTDRMDSLPTRWIGTLGTVLQRLLESMLWRACFCLEVLCFPRGILFAPHPPRPRLAILEHSCFLTTESGSRKRERSCDNTTAPLAASHYTHTQRITDLNRSTITFPAIAVLCWSTPIDHLRYKTSPSLRQRTHPLLIVTTLVHFPYTL